MKTITIDFDTYQRELVEAKELGKTQFQTEFKNQIINNLEIIRADVMSGIQKGVPPHALNSAKESARNWLIKNFTDEDLRILLNNR